MVGSCRFRSTWDRSPIQGTDRTAELKDFLSMGEGIYRPRSSIMDVERSVGFTQERRQSEHNMKERSLQKSHQSKASSICETEVWLELQIQLGGRSWDPVLRLIEGVHDKTKGISKGALKNWVVKAFLDWRVLALSLKDKKAVVNNVHHVLNVPVVALVSIIGPLIFHVKSVGFFVQILFQVSMMMYFLGDTAKRIIDAIYFVFILGPHDVGDSVIIDEFKMVVEEVYLTITLFARKDIKDKMMYTNSDPQKLISCNNSSGAKESNPFLQ